MSNVLEFYIKMKDFMGQGLIKVAKQTGDTMRKIKTEVEGASERVRKLGDEFEKTGNKAGTSGVKLGAYVRSLAGLAAVTAGMSLGAGMVMDAAKMGATQKSFEVLTGDKQTGAALTDQLRGLATDTILGPEVFKHAQTMMGFGVGSGEVVPMLNMLGDVAMGDAQKLQSLVLAFSQVQAAGRLTGQDLLQFVTAGFNPLKEISDATGVSLDVLKKRMEKGGISADMITGALQRATGQGGKFNNMMGQIGETTYGRIVKMQGAWEELRVKVGEALIPLAENLMSVAGFLMDNTELVVAAVGAWGLYTAITSAATIQQNLLNLSMAINPVVLLIAALVGLIAYLAMVRDKTKSWKESLLSLWQVVEGFANHHVAAFKFLADSVGYYMQFAFFKVKHFFDYLVAVGQRGGKIMAAITSGNFAEAATLATSPITTMAEQSLAALEVERRNDLQAFANRAGAANAQMSAGWAGFTGNRKDVSVKGLIKSGLADFTNLITPGGMAPGGPGGDAAAREAAAGITGGGPRTITINLGKMVESINLYTGSVEQGLDDMEQRITDVFLRVLNSGATVQ